MDTRPQPGAPEDFPCAKEKAQSLKCLDDNSYNYDKCFHAFENFKFCVKFWAEVKKVRRRYDVEPAMPTPAERVEIFKIYKATGEIPDYSKHQGRMPPVP